MSKEQAILDMEKAEEALVEARRLIILLLRNIGDRSRCKSCGAEIYWVVHKNGNKAPYTQLAEDHRGCKS